MAVAEYLVPEDLPTAIALLGRHRAGLTVMAGGTVVMSQLNDGILRPERILSLRRAGLAGLAVRPDERGGGRPDVLAIGAATTLSRLAGQGTVGLLAEAARSTGSWSIRNMASVGGNLFTPPPGGDVAVALLALDTRLRLASVRGERLVDLADFFTGFRSTVLAEDELLVELLVPTSWAETAFVKFGRKHAGTPAVVTVAVALERRDGRVGAARIALGAVGPHPIRAGAAENAIVGSNLEPEAIERAAAEAAAECRPVDDALASAWYRRRMAGVFVRHALERIAAGQPGSPMKEA